MPFKDKATAKAYREANKESKKAYDANFKKENRDKWNEYQKSHKIARRKKVVEDIKSKVEKMNLSEVNSLTYKAAVIILLILKEGDLKEWAIAYRTGFDIDEVKLIFANWSKNGVVENGVFVGDEEFVGEDGWMGFILVAMCGAGEIVRYKKEM